MHYFDLLLGLNLQLFADGGAAGAAAAGDGAGQGAGVTGVAAASQTGEKTSDEGASAAEMQTPQAQESPENLEAEWEGLIKGKYKSLFQRDTQNIVQKRFKNTDEIVKKFNEISPMLDLLAANKYNVKAGDIKALAAAIEADDDLYEQEALEEGTTPKELRQRKTLQRQNQDLMRELNQRKEADFARQQMDQWEQQAALARQTYPNLDLNTEAKNPQFRQLLQAGVDVGTAYMVIHKDDVLAGAMQHTAKKVEEKLTNKIIANGTRPSENGMASQSAAVTKSDPSLFTREERRALARRAASGERITL